MFKIRLLCIATFFIILIFASVACTNSEEWSLEESQRVAEEFVKKEATFKFDGIPETLKVVNATSVGDGWEFTIQFDSRHAGYGDRSGQASGETVSTGPGLAFQLSERLRAGKHLRLF